MSALYLAITEPIAGLESPRAWRIPIGSSTHLDHALLGYTSGKSCGDATPVLSWLNANSGFIIGDDSPNRQPHHPNPPMAIPLLPPQLHNSPGSPYYSNEAQTPPNSTVLDSGEIDASPRASRPKSHACWMCHKSFDRPSTLRKHLLVHTGEKAYSCQICERRFGVASNLNRHTRRCAVRPVNAPRGTSGAAIASSAATPVEGSNSAARGRSQISRGPATDPATVSPAPSRAERTRCSQGAQPKPKRRRRAPSPSRWIPDSLRYFDLSPYKKSAPAPLPAVTPSPFGGLFEEERDSFDENTSATPYHPSGWSGKLPGPAIIPSDVTNTKGLHFTYEYVF